LDTPSFFFYGNFVVRARNENVAIKIIYSCCSEGLGPTRFHISTEVYHRINVRSHVQAEILKLESAVKCSASKQSV